MVALPIMGIAQTGKTTAIRCITDGETCVSPYLRALIEALPEIPRTLQYYNIDGFKEGP